MPSEHRALSATFVFRQLPYQNEDHKAASFVFCLKDMEILLVKDVTSRLKISSATLYRWVEASRTGTGSFPLPISERGQTLCWNSDDIDAWCRSQTKPVVSAPVVRQKSCLPEKRSTRCFHRRKQSPESFGSELFLHFRSEVILILFLFHCSFSCHIPFNSVALNFSSDVANCL